MFGFGRNKKPGRLGSVRSFAIFYGLPSETIIDWLAQTDLVVLEPSQWQYDKLARLRASGTAIYGYLSVMETPSWNERRISCIKEEDKLTVDGRPVHFPMWDSFLMDLRSPGYRSLLLQEIGAMAETLPLDGIFLDTVGDIEEYVPLSKREEMGRAYMTLLSVAAGRYPHLKWIQNRGFDQLKRCASVLDGLLWEGWRGDEADTEWTKARLQLVEQLRKDGLTILSVSADSSEIHRKTAEKLGFIHWTSPESGGYNQGR
ncbi:endo alpha-1,4 polygalactosaminidase [Paenibacillus sp. MMO-177]|uniref:endo alpha-1,4 polygalactosaminidase n=1 Tax=Paenibacillus sp. MMO-177 TaxID=3081289 RepID=UPI003017750B